jgi:hypothetical protein
MIDGWLSIKCMDKGDKDMNRGNISMNRANLSKEGTWDRNTVDIMKDSRGSHIHIYTNRKVYKISA